jgi:peptidoglycan hydrolase-like protein with peptidoglycan-binding domain
MTASRIDPRAIQRALAKQDLYSGAIDGVLGKQSRSAIDLALARKEIDLSGWDERRRIVAYEQMVLRAPPGEYAGPIDGKVGPLTEAAYARWEAAEEPPPAPAVANDNRLDRAAFFAIVRPRLFGGSLTQSQVEAILRYLDYRAAAWPGMSDPELAYLLATVKHETEHEMVPVVERGGAAYLRSKPYYPWYGRGPIQLTWEANYRKFGITDPDAALEWPAALDIAFRGMILGMFTGRKLADYISGARRDYVAARRIINGTDRAHLVAGYAESFLEALLAGRRAAA